MPVVIRVLIPLAIVALGLVGWKVFGVPVEPPEPEPGSQQVLQTEKLELSPTRFPIVLQSQGTVRAHHTTTITPLVGGTIRHIHSSFEDGAFFKQGDVLAELETADFQAAVVASESRLARAEAVLAQEDARAKQALLNWQDLGYQDEEPSPLVLREPQLKEARANVSAAHADLDQMLRNLDRTKIRAPFDGRVKQRMVGLGQAVGAQTALGEVFTTDFAEIRLPLSPSQISFVNLPTFDSDPPVPVLLTDALAGNTGGNATTWQAKIVRTEGALDEASRELFAIARIDDPFGLRSEKPELRIGQPVRAAIEGITLEDVFVIPRSALRGINRIFLIDRHDPKLLRTDIKPLWSNADVLVIRDGIKPGDWLATSRLPWAPNEAPVEVIQPPSSVEADGKESTTSSGS